MIVIHGHGLEGDMVLGTVYLNSSLSETAFIGSLTRYVYLKSV